MILGDAGGPGNPGHLVLTGGEKRDKGVKRVVWGSQRWLWGVEPGAFTGASGDLGSRSLLPLAVGGGRWVGWSDEKPGVPLYSF